MEGVAHDVAVQETGLVERLEGFSLKHIDLIELEKGLAPLDLELKLGGYELAAKPVPLRTEIKEAEDYLLAAARYTLETWGKCPIEN